MTNDSVARINPLQLVREGFTLARRVIEELIDDIDGSEATETVRFSYRGTDYEVDLSERNSAKMDKALARYVAAARKVKGTRPGRSVVARASSGGVDSKVVREWARGEGIEVSDRGRVPSDVVGQYLEAHGS